MAFSLPEQLTEQFYEWEQRGRGWYLYDQPVDIEPPFEPFFYHDVSTYPIVDDGKKASLLSEFVDLVTAPFSEDKDRGDEKKPEAPTIAPTLFTCTEPVQILSVSLPKGYKIDEARMRQLLLMLSYSNYQIGFEIIAKYDSIVFQFACFESDKVQVLSQLKAHFPESVIRLSVDAFSTIENNTNIYIAELGLREEFMRPIESIKRLDPDYFTGLLGTMENLEEDEHCGIQVLFKGVTHPWSSSILRSVMDNQGDAFFMNAPEMVPLAKEKVSSPLFSVAIRTLGTSKSNAERAQFLTSNIAQAILRISNSGVNSLIPLPIADSYSFGDCFSDLIFRETHRTGMILNVNELMTFVHLPSVSVTSEKLSRQAVKTKALPRELRQGTYQLGLNTHLGQEYRAFLRDEHRLRHMHVIGTTGVGKSTLLSQLCLQDIGHGNGCAMFDPHGDTIDDVINRIPQERLNDVILCDPTDTEFPVGLNLMQATTDIEKIVLSSDLVDTFKARSITWGDTMTSVLANAITAFLESEQGGTLLDLRRFLLDDSFRREFLLTVKDSRIISFWREDYPQLRKGNIAPLLTRLDTFLRPKIIRNMMAQKKGIDFNDVLSSKKILLVKLAQGLIGEDNSYLLGTLILAKLYQAAQARQSLSKSERSPFYVYIDEFHHFITPSLAAILSGARKYSFGLILAHQELNQVISEDFNIGNSIISNPGIRVCFRLGDNDAKKLETGFQSFDENDLQNLGIGEAIVRVGKSDYDFNITTEKLPEADIDNLNLAAITANTQKNYATPKHEVEQIVDKVFQFEVRPEKSKDVIKTTKDEPVIEDQVLPTEEIIKRSEKDVTKASEEYVETIERQREVKEHRYIQEYVKKMAEQRGFKAELEMPTSGGGRIDIVLTKNQHRIACEISVTNTIEYETQNLLKCLESGYTYVVMLCNNETRLRSIQQSAQQLIPTSLFGKISFFHPDRLIEYLDSIVAQETKSETRTRGYRVKTSFSATQNSEQQKKAIQDTISRAIQRDRNISP